jgi:hypothetical protein
MNCLGELEFNSYKKQFLIRIYYLSLGLILDINDPSSGNWSVNTKKIWNEWKLRLPKKTKVKFLKSN